MSNTQCDLRPPLASTASPRDGEPLASEYERLRAWHEARLNRKLRGEYESAVLHLAELINQNVDAPLRVSAVRIEGAKNTKEFFLNALVSPVLAASNPSPSGLDPSPSPSTASLADVLHSTRALSSLLQSTDAFAALEARIERSTHVLASDDEVDIVMKVRERGRVMLKTGGEFGNGEGSANLTGSLRNILGIADTLSVNFTTGTQTRRAVHTALSFPLVTYPFLPAISRTRLPTIDSWAEVSAYARERDNATFASSRLAEQGIRLAVKTKGWAAGMHEFAYEGVQRRIHGLTPSASMSMRAAAGSSVKSALSHSYTLDTRTFRPYSPQSTTAAVLETELTSDGSTPAGADAPTTKLASTYDSGSMSGAYLKLSQELAGLGGDAAHWKGEGETNLVSGWKGLTSSLSLRGGVLLSPKDKASLWPDRYQLGGPTSIRAFKVGGLGPRDAGDAVGGDVFWAAGLSVIGDIPRKPHWPVKTHAWLNAGQLDALDTKSHSLPKSLLRPSVSVGLGLLYRFDPVRVEVNFGVPLVASRSDSARRGIQVGMGLEFL